MRRNTAPLKMAFAVVLLDCLYQVFIAIDAQDLLPKNDLSPTAIAFAIMTCGLAVVWTFTAVLLAYGMIQALALPISRPAKVRRPSAMKGRPIVSPNHPSASIVPRPKE